MKKLFTLFSLVIAFLFIGIVGFSQQWKKNLPDKKDGNYTLYEYQKAFNDYWAPYKIEEGKYIDENGVKRKAIGYKQFKRWEQYWEPRVDRKTGEFPSKSSWDIWQEYSSNLNIKSVGGTWVSTGAANVDPIDGGALQESGTGRLNCAAFDPNDNNHFWVGAPSGGVWETTNAGSTWACLTDQNPILGISVIALPFNYNKTSNPTIYIATGDRDALDDPSVGVLKTTNGGLTWVKTGLTFPSSTNKRIGGLVCSETDANNIVAATSQGIFKSTDAGATWTQTQAGNFIDMDLIHNTTTLIASTIGTADAYRSTDFGSTWTKVYTGVTGTTGEYRADIATTRANTTTVYMITDYYETDALYAIYKSTNGGASFTKVYDGLTQNNLYGWDVTNTEADGGQGWYDVTLAVSNTDANVVYVGGVNAYISTNGAVSFTICNGWDSGLSSDVVHADHHNAYFRTSDNRLFDVNDGGIYYSTNVTLGGSSTWTCITDGIVTGQIYDIGVSQTESGSTVAGYQDNGTKYLNYNVSTTYWSIVREGDGCECAIDPTNVVNQWGSYPGGYLYRTTNEWASYSLLSSTAGAWSFPVEADPRNASTVYVGKGVVTRYVGTTATTMSATLDGTSYLRTMDVYNDGTNLVIWTGGLTGLWRSNTSGTTFVSVYAGLPGNVVTDIAIDPNDYSHVYVSLGGYDHNSVYETTDNGATWTNISAGLPPVPAGAVVVNKQNTTEKEVYVGTDAGIYVKIGDSEWKFFNTGIPFVSITDLEIYYNATPANSKIYAATYGRGSWTSDLYSVPTTPMTYVSSTTTQNNTDLTYQGTIDQEIIGIQIVTNGSTSPLSATSFTFNTTGSTNASTDILNAKVYYTGNNNNFSAVNAFGSVIANPNGSFTVTGSQTLSCGTNYFWLVYDIKATATLGDVVDASCTSLTVGTPRTPTVTAPSGNRLISDCNLCYSYGTSALTFGTSRVVFNTIDNSSVKATDGNGYYYSDYTSLSTTVTASQSYNLSVYVTIYSTYTTAAKAWIDWNHDCDFDDIGEDYYVGTRVTSNGITSLSPLSITVPGNALPGPTTMRVTSNYSGQGLNPCATGIYGEVEDYTINVIYPPSPTITAASPDNFYTDKGKQLTLTGTNLDYVTSVTIGGVSGTINSQAATSLTVTFPAGYYSNNTLTATTPGGTATYTVTVNKRNTIPVGGGTDFHTTVQSALNGLSAWYGTISFDAGQLPGTKFIDVYNGTYTETVTPNVALVPSTTNRLVIQNHIGESPVINATGLANGFYIGALNYVTVTGFSVYGANLDNIYTEGDYNVISYNKSYSSVGGSGIRLSAANNSTVDHNLVYGNYNYGIHLISNSTITVENNTIYDNGHTVPAQSNVTIFTEGWESGSTGWTLTNWAVAASNPYTGTNSLRVSSTSGTATYSGINISGYTNVRFQFYTRESVSSTTTLTARYQLDGGSWTSVYSGDPGTTYILRPLTPTSLVGSVLNIDFTGVTSNASRYVHIDDISIIGDVPSSNLGSGIYVQSGTGTTVENNILFAKTGNDAYYALQSASGITVTSLYNNYYSTNTSLFNYNGSIGNTGPKTASDITSDPLFVNAPTDFHLRSTAGSYNGGVWPPTILSGGTWTLDATNTSPSIDAGTGTVSNEPAPNGGLVNQGAYGNTVQASKTGCSMPVAPTSVSASLTTICNGDNTTLSYTGGSGTTFNWYSSSCGTGLVGSGNNLTVSPTSTTTYYGRWENTCGNSTCQSVTVTVTPVVVAPTSVSASLTTICSGNSTTLSYTGGSGTTFNWYSSSCGTGLVGSGNNLTVSPTGTTTYYGRWENTCGNSTCQSVTVTVNPLAVAPTSVSASLTTICNGDNTSLSYTGGSGTTFNWYSSSCGTGLVGSGNNLTVAPTSTTTYYGRWENTCGNSTCQSVTVTVNDILAQPSVITGSTSPGIGSSQTYSVTNVPGVTYTWSVPGDWTIDAGQGTNSIDVTVGSNSGNVSVTPSNSCGDGTPQTLAVTPVVSALTWDGSVSNDWLTAGNWTPAIVPTATDNVIIAAVATLPLINDGIGTIAVCNNLTINAGAIVTIASNGYLTVNGSITNSAGNAGLVIQSDATGTGSLIHNSGSGVSATVQSYNAGTQWHMFSSPINNASFTVLPTLANTIQYDESTADYWTGIVYGAGSVNGWVSIPANMVNAKGYVHYFNTNATLNYTGTLNPNTTTSAIVVPYTNHGVTEPNTSASWDDFDGWNLIGNPYTSAIDWDDASVDHAGANLLNAVYTYDDKTAHNYTSYVGGVSTNGGSRYIPAMQGFFVKGDATETGGTLNIGANARVHNALLYWKGYMETPSNFIRLEISGNGFKDETVVRMLPDATNAMDNGMDAYKFFTWHESVPQIYTRTEGSADYSINTVPVLEEGSVSVPIRMVQTGESYSIRISEFNFIGVKVYLKDNLNSVTEEIALDDVIELTADESDANGRYELVFDKSSGSIVSDVNNIDVTIYPNPNEGTFTIRLEHYYSGYELEIANVIGQLFYKNVFEDAYAKEIKIIGANAGVYFLKIRLDDGSVVNRKIIVNY
jgi:parallel beta-helix repeat protein